MDTIIIRIYGLDKFRVASWAIFNQEFTIRTYADLSQTERMRATDKKVPYLRPFVLRPNVKNDPAYPKVEIYEKADAQSRSVGYEMVLSVSLPKLLNGNSLQEIAVNDLQKILGICVERLYSMGIHATPQTIAGASVSVVHFCKNIPLLPTYPLRAILAELSHVDIGKAYDNTNDIRSKNKNESETLHLFCGTREWAFYDKIQEMLRPSGKSLEKQKTPYEKELIEFHNLSNKEVFRYEYRLKKAQTIKSEINQMLKRPYQTPVTFADLFAENLWKSVLLNSWKRILAKPENQLALLKPSSELDLLLRILKKAKEKEQSVHSQNQALWSYGLAAAIKKFGAKTIRKEMSKIWSKRADSRLDDKLVIAAELASGLPLSDGILYIDKELSEFKPISLESLST